ncbi:MAG: helix-hairpin-helix domain-containing protein, partial [bacterium]
DDHELALAEIRGDLQNLATPPLICLDELDIIQMAGRAGRYGIDDEGHVYLVLPEYTTEHWKGVFESPRPVTSVLNSPPILAFHTLAEIMNSEIEDPISMLGWFKRSLAYKQGDYFTVDDAQYLMTILYKMEMLTNEIGLTKLTNLGRVAALLYFSPYDVFAWYRNFDAIMSGKVDLNDLTLAWAFASIPSNELGYIPKDLEDVCQQYRWTLRTMGVESFEGMPSVVATAMAIEGTPDDDVPPSLRATQRNLQFDAERTVEAIRFIDRLYTKWERPHLWEVLPLRVKYGVPEEMAQLTRIKGIGRARAQKLWEKGFKTLKDIADPTRKSELAKFLTPKLIASTQESAKKLMKG